MPRRSEVAGCITKSPLDKKDYRGLTLANGLKVLLISDPLTDEAAASLSVAAGSMNDPKELQGLAHFCEHMLCMGTAKYPAENDYNKFLADHGGSANAYTERDHTNYYFDVSPLSLDGALDRFAQFFISPLFTESATEREINAVNSEHEKNITDDVWRINEVEHRTANPKHPYSYFNTGNRQTLWTRPRENSIDVRCALMEFHQAYYSANLMSLVVLGAECLDDLQILVESMFLGIENRNVQMPFWSENPYGPNELQTRIEIVPINDIRSLSLMFPVPDTTTDYKSSVRNYLSHLIGHEGEGSLLSLLKNKNWVSDLGTSYDIPARGFAIFVVTFILTPTGFNNADNIIHHIFEYIEMLKELGPQKWVWEEVRDVYAMHFRFKEEEEPRELVARLTSTLRNYPLEDALNNAYNLTDYNPSLIREILDCMTPHNSRVTLVSKTFESTASLVEEWYGVKYNRQKIPQKTLEKWEKASRNRKHLLPPKNEFIPSIFELKERDEEGGIVPRIITDTPLSKVWYLQDNEFMRPQAVIWAELYSPLPLNDPVTANLNQMFVSLIRDSLTEYSYAATVAGLRYDIVDTAYGIEIVVDGYDHKLELLLNRVIEKLVNFQVVEERFEVIKDRYSRYLKNLETEQPYVHVLYYFNYLLTEKRWSYQDLMATMNHVTMKGLVAYSKAFMSKVRVEWLIHGNFTSTTEASNIAKKCMERFEENGAIPLDPSQINRLSEIKLPFGADFIFKSEHKTHLSSCVAVLFQTGKQENKHNVLVELLEHIINEPFYNQIRTKEQLGYAVWTSVRRANGTIGIRLLVQGDRHPAFLESRIHSFLDDLVPLLRNMTDQTFLQHRTALGVRKAVKPKRLMERTYLVWSEIASQQYNFGKQQAELVELGKITLEELQGFYNEIMAPGAPKSKKLTVQVVSMAEGGAGIKPDEINAAKKWETDKHRYLIEDVVKWKEQRELYPPHPKP